MSKLEGIDGATFVLLGSPGAGKSTQGLCLSRILEGNFLSTGDLLREEVNSQSVLGQQIEPILRVGGTVPTSLLLDVLKTAIEAVSPEQYFILDFAGNGDQCPAIDEMLAQYGRAICISFFLNVPPSESRLRLTARGRIDDNPEMIDKRLALYKVEADPVNKYYKERGLLHSIDGVGDVEEITERLLARILSLGNE